MTQVFGSYFEPTSRRQVSAWAAGGSPAPEEAAQDVWAVPMPIPAGNLAYALTYVLLSPRGVHVIDPGWDSEAGIGILRSALRDLGSDLQDVRTVLATHFHPDHLGNAHRLRALTGAQVLLSATERTVLAQETSPDRHDRVAGAAQLERWGVPSTRHRELLDSFDRPALIDDLDPDRLIADGDRLELSGHTLEAIATPGHTGGHLCFADADRRIIYTGDHVLPETYSGIGIGVLPGADALADYFSSLDRLSEFDAFEALPGHEYRFRGLQARRTAIAAHHRRRMREVSRLTAELGDAPAWDYAGRMTWTMGWDRLTGFWLHSAVRQAAMHLEFVRSGRATPYLDLDLDLEP